MHKSYKKSLKKKSLQKKHKNTKKRKLAKLQKGGAGSTGSTGSPYNDNNNNNPNPIPMRPIETINSNTFVDLSTSDDLIKELEYWNKITTTLKKELLNLKEQNSKLNSKSNTQQQKNSISMEITRLKGNLHKLANKILSAIDEETQAQVQ